MAFYVDPDSGNDSGTGAIGDPFRTIRRGIQALPSGFAEELILREGEFTETQVDILNRGGGADWSNKWLIRPETGETVVFKSTGGSRCFHLQGANCKYIEFADFALDGDNVSSDLMKVTYPSNTADAAHHIRLNRMTLRNSPGQGLLLTTNSRNCEALDCIVHDNGADPNSNLLHGLYWGGHDGLIRGGHYYNNATFQIHLVNNSDPTGARGTIVEGILAERITRGRKGIIIADGSDITVRNCVIRNIPADGAIHIYFDAVNAKVYHNTIVDSAAGIWAQGGTGHEIRNNLIWNCTQTIVNNVGAISTNNYTSPDPIFVNGAAGDYHLQGTSPALDTVPRLASVLTDYDGFTRPDPCDPGAFERDGGIGGGGGGGGTDVLVDTALPSVGTSKRWGGETRAWLSNLVGYEFFLGNFDALEIYRRKTSVGGETWQTAVRFYDRGGEGGIQQIGIWAEWWTKGDMGTKIHVAWLDGGDRLRHSYLDTVGDTIGPVTDITSTAIDGTLVGFHQASVSITKTEAGNLLVFGRPPSEMWESTNGGLNWTQRNDNQEVVPDDSTLHPAAGTGDTGDACQLYVDENTDQLSIKMWDRSGDSHAETIIATHVEDATGNYRNFDGVLSPATEKLYVVHCSEHNSATANLEAWIVLPNAHPAPAPTQKTNVLSNTQAVVSPRLLVDDNSGDIYCFYLRGTLGTAMSVYYKVSTDEMDTWSAEVPYSAEAAAAYRNLHTARLIPLGRAGRIAASWTDETDRDILTNFTNSIQIAAAAPGGNAPRASYYHHMQRVA